jgi:AMMECR1 domain-containing protein
MDRETFLAHTCAKAGLAADCWRKGARVYRFTADVFGG